MEKNHLLHQPLLYKTTISSTTTTTNSELNITSKSPGIIPRLVFLFFIGTISLWANYESSKGFNITILNEAGSNTQAHKRFDLFYISNDEITRLILRTSRLIEDILYSSDDDINFKKQVNHLIIKLSSRNLTSSTEGNNEATKRVVVSSLNEDKYVIEISSLVMEGDDFRKNMVLAIQYGMAKVWLFNGNGNAPKILVNGIVKYVSNFAAFNNKNQTLSFKKLMMLSEDFWLKEMDEDEVGRFLNNCEVNMSGFVRRLNQEMKDGWSDEMLPKVCKRLFSHLMINTTTWSNMESNV